MLKSYVEAVCWLATHDRAVLVVREYNARVVDIRYRADGLHMRSAQALLEPRRVIWFDVEEDGTQRLMRLNSAGETYHLQLVTRRKCLCRPGGRTEAVPTTTKGTSDASAQG